MAVWATSGPRWPRRVFETKHAKVTPNLWSTQKIKTEQQPSSAAQPSDLINNSGADLMPMDALINDNALTDLGALLDAPSWDDPNGRFGTRCCRAPSTTAPTTARSTC